MFALCHPITPPAFHRYREAPISGDPGAGRHLAHGVVVGSILLLAAVANMLMLPYPIWFWIVNLVLFPVGCLWGVRPGWGEHELRSE